MGCITDVHMYHLYVFRGQIYVGKSIDRGHVNSKTARNKLCWLVVFCWLEIMDDFPLGSQLWDCGQNPALDLMFFGVKVDQVSPT